MKKMPVLLRVMAYFLTMFSISLIQHGMHRNRTETAKNVAFISFSTVISLSVAEIVFSEASSSRNRIIPQLTQISISFNAIINKRSHM